MFRLLLTVLFSIIETVRSQLRLHLLPALCIVLAYQCGIVRSFLPFEITEAFNKAYLFLVLFRKVDILALNYILLELGFISFITEALFEVFRISIYMHIHIYVFMVNLINHYSKLFICILCCFNCKSKLNCDPLLNIINLLTDMIVYS